VEIAASVDLRSQLRPVGVMTRTNAVWEKPIRSGWPSACLDLTSDAKSLTMRLLSPWKVTSDYEKHSALIIRPQVRYTLALAIRSRTIHNDSQSRNALAVGVW